MVDTSSTKKSTFTLSLEDSSYLLEIVHSHIKDIETKILFFDLGHRDKITNLAERAWWVKNKASIEELYNKIGQQVTPT